jgi:hypothetical protein
MRFQTHKCCSKIRTLVSPAIEVTRVVNSDKTDGRRNRDTMWVELLDTEAQPGGQRSHCRTAGWTPDKRVEGWEMGWGLTNLKHKPHPVLNDTSKHRV